MVESLTSALWEVTIREMVIGSVDRSVILTAWKLTFWCCRSSARDWSEGVSSSLLELECPSGHLSSEESSWLEYYMASLRICWCCCQGLS